MRGVALYAITYSCIKSTNYGFLFWLPDFIKNTNTHYGNEKLSKTNIPSMFDYGTFFGGVLVGYLSDKYGKRAYIMIPSLLFSTVLMVIVRFVLEDNVFTYYLLILLIGFFFGGPYNIISAAISIDLAK